MLVDLAVIVKACVDLSEALLNSRWGVQALHARGRSNERRGTGILPAYLAEMCFRYNNRKNPYLFCDSIVELINAPNFEYKELTAQQAEPAA